ncbi:MULTISPECIES: acyltransferase domain-containing protein, partial [unclassified Streptomyces]|uniref:acyltransferase domain-containing protein n=1 Tax=unclassified Streptomyces TaxID=2593676 RepID=UPI003787B082
RLLDQARDWPDAGRPRRAAVSSFGVSGTNAHLILEEAAPEPLPAERELPAGQGVSGLVPWVLSARSAEALREQAARLAVWTGPQGPGHGDRPADIGYALATTRSVFEHRAVVWGTDTARLRQGLQALAEGREDSQTVHGHAQPGKTGWMFTGQGAQYPGMGRDLYRDFPAFATAFDEVCTAFTPYLTAPLKDIVFDQGPEAKATLERTEWAQPALFAFAVALAALARSWNIPAHAMTGHSIGELAAAHLAGLWNLDDACRIVAARGRLMQTLPEGGAMAAVQATEEEILPLIAPHTHTLSIAAVNAPNSLVLSGDTTTLTGLTTTLTSQGRKVTPLHVSHAFHSPHMNPVLDAFATVLDTATFHPTHTPLPHTPQLTDPAYWVRHLRDTVRHHDNIQWMTRQGITHLIEIGPDAPLTALTHHNLTHHPHIHTTPLQRRTHPQTHTALTAAAHIHTHTTPLNWTTHHTPHHPHTTPLPTYHFQHHHYWLNAGAPQSTAAGLDPADHPLLTAVHHLPDSETTILTGTISLATHAWLADHQVGETVLVPGTALVEMALHAGLHTGHPTLDELLITTPLPLRPGTPVQVHVTVNAPQAEGRRPFTLHSRTRTGDEWTTHATGLLSTVADPSGAATPDAWPPAGAKRLDTDTFYEDLLEEGFAYGPHFQGLQALWQDGDDLYAEVSLPEGTADGSSYHVHPALLDAALHPLLFVRASQEPGTVWLPFQWNGLTVRTTGATSLRVVLSSIDEERYRVLVTDDRGLPVAEASSFTGRTARLSGINAAHSADNNALFVVGWEPVDVSAVSVPGDTTWLFPDTGGEEA